MSTLLDTHGWARFAEDLARMSGQTFEHALLDQTRAVLAICLRRTRAAKVARIVKKVSRHNNYIKFEDGRVVSVWKKADHAEMFLDESNFYADANFSARTAKRGGKAPTIVKGKTWHEMNSPNRHWSDRRWSMYQSYLAEARTRKVDLAAAKRSRGLSKASWLQIAADLGIQLDAPAYVKNAAPSNGRLYKNGTAKRVLEAAAFYIEIRNDHPIVVGRLNGAQILQGAIDTRLKAFGHEMRTGVFDDIATRAKRYPGIFVQP